MKSKTKIESQLTKKTNPELVQTVVLAKKNSAWQKVAGVLTSPGRKRKCFNLTQLFTVEGDVVIAGKILGEGEVKGKKKIVALKFSTKAEEKLKKAGCETVLLKDEILKNKEMKGVTLIK